MSKPKDLAPAQNGATYPTLEEARRRRLLLAGVAAASVTLGVSCFPPFATAGEPPPPDWDAGGELLDAGAADAGAGDGTDAGPVEGRDS